MGFLSSLLPAVAGLALAPETGGASLGLTSGLETAALVGGGTALLTGNLGKGLMAGLGAYGGAQMAGGIAGLGTSESGADIEAAIEAQKDEAVKKAVAQRQMELSQLGAGSENMNIAMGGGQLSPDEIANIRNTTAQGFQLTPELQAKIDNPFQRGVSSLLNNDSSTDASLTDKLKQIGGGSYSGLAKLGVMAASPGIPSLLAKPAAPAPTSGDLGIRYRYSPGTANPMPTSTGLSGAEPSYFPNQGYTRISAADSKALYGFAGGGDIQGDDPSDTQGDPNMMDVKSYDPVVRMASGGRSKAADTDPMKKPKGLSDMPGLDAYPGLSDAAGLYAHGGLSAAYNLGGYSDGGRLLKGPGDGVSDSIPATIGNKRPARLADGEFVVPARIVSELGNGSTEAGARQLYAMMDRVQKARGKTTGKDKVAQNTRAAKYLPA